MIIPVLLAVIVLTAIGAEDRSAVFGRAEGGEGGDARCGRAGAPEPARGAT